MYVCMYVCIYFCMCTFTHLNSYPLMYACIFHEAYPMIVSGVQLGQSNDEFARINVTFSFFKWTTPDNDRNSEDYEEDGR